jgi:NADPH:quinone reductase-like Zn-dependent oxidoreductase
MQSSGRALGLDMAGVVVEVGPGVSHLKVGDRVYGVASVLTGASGAFAELGIARKPFRPC